MTVIYFISKVAFSKIHAISNFQILNQFVIMIYCCYIFCFVLKKYLTFESMASWKKKVFHVIASLTLEIYVVQLALIKHLLPIYSFPLSLLTTTTAIFVTAYLLHILGGFITEKLNAALFSIKATKAKGENA